MPVLNHYKRGVRMANGLKIKILGDATDLEKSLKNLKTIGTTSLNGLKTVGEKAMKSLATVGTASIGAITAGLTASVNAGKDFEQTFAKASTLFGDVAVDADNLKTKMLQISSTTGVAATELNEALYSALSAGIEVTEDMATSTDFLENSAKLAKAGFTDVETAISATAKTLNAYNLPASETASIQNMLIQTQNKGITTVDELGQTLAQVTPTAAGFGVAFDQVSASLSTMTAQGTPTAQATTQLNSLIAELGKSGTTAAKNLEEAAKGSEYAGMSFAEMMDKGATLGDVLSMMNDYAAKTGVSLVDVFSSIEAGKAALSIFTNDGAKFNENLQAMADSAGMVDAAYEKMSNTLEMQLDKLKQGVTNLGIAIYQENDTVFAQMASFGAECISKISEGFESGGTEGMITALGNVLSDVVTKATENLPNVFDIAENLLNSVVDGIDQNLPKLSTAAESIITTLKDDITNFIPKLKPIVKEIGNILVQGVVAYQQVFWTTALNIVSALAEGIAKNSKTISKQIVNVINNIITTATDNLPTLIDAAGEILTNVMQSLADNADTITSNIKELIVQLCNAISNNAPQLVQTAIELVKALVKGIIDNAGEIIEALLGTIGSLLTELGKVSPLIIGVGAAITANFVTSTILSTVNAIKAAIKATEGLTIAQKLLNATQLSSPIGWITLAVGALATVLTGLAVASDDAADSQAKLTEAQQKTIEKSEEFRQGIQDNIDALDNQVSKISAEFDYYDDLAKELDTIVDKNGKIKDGYEDRAKVITNELSEALGIEIDVNNQIIDSYDILQDKLRETIELKQAQTMLDNSNDKYMAALENEKNATEELADSWSAVADEKEKNEKLKSLKSELEELYNDRSVDNWSERVQGLWNEYKDLTGDVKQGFGAIDEAIESSDAKLKKCNENYNESTNEIAKNQAVIESYEELQAAIASGNLERIQLATEAMKFTAQNEKAFTLENLEEQKKYLEEQLKTQQERVEAHEEGAEELLATTEKKLNEINKTIASKFILDTIGENAMESLANGIESGSEKDVNKAVENVAIMCGIGLTKAQDGSYQIGENTAKEIAKGIKNGKITAEDAAQEIANAILNTISSDENINAAQTNGEDIAHAIASGAQSAIAIEQRKQEAEAKQAEAAAEKAAQRQAQLEKDRQAALEKNQKAAEEAAKAEEEAEKAAEEAAKKAAEEAKKKAEEAKKLAKERKQLVKDANKTAKEAYREIKSELSDIVQEHKDKLSDLYKEYQNTLGDIKQEYQNTLDSIANSQASYADKIMSFSDLFGFTEQNTIYSSNAVLNNIAKTTEQYEEFYRTIGALKSRGISDDLLSQFTDLGVGATAQLKQIAQMDDMELIAYQEMLKKQQDIADKIAAEKYKNEKKTAEKEYNEAKAEADAQYNADVKAQNERYKRQIKKLTTDTKTYMEELGEQLKKGLKKGSKMSNEEAEKIAANLVDKVKKKVKKKLKINSPSKVYEDEIGEMIPAGVAKGVDNGTGDVVKSAELQVDQLNKAYDNISVANKIESAFAKAKTAVGTNLSDISANITAGSPTTVVYNNCNNVTNNNDNTQNVTFEDTMQAPDEVARAIKYNNLYGLGGSTT